MVEGKGKEESGKWEESELMDAIRKELQKGKSAKEISVDLAAQSGWNKKDVYSLINSVK